MATKKIKKVNPVFEVKFHDHDVLVATESARRKLARSNENGEGGAIFVQLFFHPDGTFRLKGRFLEKQYVDEINGVLVRRGREHGS